MSRDTKPETGADGGQDAFGTEAAKDDELLQDLRRIYVAVSVLVVLVWFPMIPVPVVPRWLVTAVVYAYSVLKSSAFGPTATQLWVVVGAITATVVADRVTIGYVAVGVLGVMGGARFLWDTYYLLRYGSAG